MLEKAIDTYLEEKLKPVLKDLEKSRNACEFLIERNKSLEERISILEIQRDERLLSVERTCEMLGCSRSTLYRLIESKQITGVIGHGNKHVPTLIPYSSVMQFIHRGKPNEQSTSPKLIQPGLPRQQRPKQQWHDVVTPIG